MGDALVELLLDLKANRISREQFKAAMREATGEETPRDLVRLAPVWESAPASAAAQAIEDHVVLLAGVPHAAEALRADTSAVHVLHSPAGTPAGRYPDLAAQLLDVLRQLGTAAASPRTLVQLGCPADGEDALAAGLLGMLRTAALENPRIVPQLVQLDAGDDCARRILDCRALAEHPAVRYRDGAREVLAWRELPAQRENTALPWREDGTYVITGGLGGLGLIVAEDLLRSVRSATVYLTGRSAPTGERARALAELEALGRARYVQLDVADEAGVAEFLAGVRRDCGTVTGIIHGAGVNRDGFIRTKTTGELRDVLAPKVAGTLHLDHASRDLPLDFFVTFSSAAAVTGNVGQADYAAANAFQDAFAAHRDGLVAAGQRSGRSLSIDWPLWADGGMSVDADTARALLADIGMAPLRTETGLAVLHEFLLAGHSQVLAIEGDGERIRRTFLAPQQPAPLAVPEVAHGDVDQDLLRDKVLDKLGRLLGGVIGLSAAKIDPETALENYGIDSVVISQLNRKLAEVFPGLSAALLYEYNSLDSLAGYFLTEHNATCRTWTGLTAEHPAPTRTEPAPVTVPKTETPKTVDAPTNPADAIAIVGLSGRFPQARTVDDFWRNLAAGRDCVSEIPPERWGLTGFFHPDRDEAVARGLSYSKWGGFLDGFAEFDPLFFGISPHEAMSMDPQERLFLQESWNALEDAGYTRQRLARRHERRVGVFAGVSTTGFELYGPELWRQQENLHPRTSFAAVANRVSYFLDLTGPSLAIDTMCSSSLSAVHEAMEHLRRGECDAALAGGVNVYSHPASYFLMSRMRMLSDDGRCRSFGAGGTGFVPGEGVAVLVLKRLADAERDGDVIHAVLRGSSINHGGRTHGYTVPNPASQAAAVREAMDRAGIPAGDISFVETHGTGTSLGDPIEISGLSRAYAKDGAGQQYCAIGSAKSNIGHLEAAAGVAGLVKVVLQLRHGQLAPSLHAQEPNPEIDFAPTPFHLQRELAAWQRPTAADGTQRDRVAGVSSFGAGGANVHVIVAEYRAEPAVATEAPGPQVIVLSARDRTRLRARAGELANWLGRQESLPRLADLAYTLQVGREAMDSRLALRVTSVDELTGTLSAFAAGEDDPEGLHLGEVKQHRETLAAFTGDTDMSATVAAWLDKGKVDKLLDLWVKGFAFDWATLPRTGAAHHVSLPSYPFARERYWVGDIDTTPETPGATHGALHPLVHLNSSTLDVQRFDSTFSGDEFFLRDHVVRGERVLPGVAYVEMARAAITASVDGVDSVRLRNVVWARPITVTEGSARVRTTLAVEADGEVAFRISTPAGESGGEVVHCQGAAIPGGSGALTPVDVEGVRAACTDLRWDAQRCYAAYRSMGLDYGPAHRGVDGVAVGDGQALARLRLPAEAADSLAEFVVHPGLMDSALQATIGLLADPDAEGGALYLPFAVDEVQILAPLRDSMWAWVRGSADDVPGSGIRKLDIDVCTDDGAVCCRFTGFSTRAYDPAETQAPRIAAEPAQTIPAPTPKQEKATPVAVESAGTTEERAGEYLAAMLAGEVRMPADRIDLDDAFEVYGIDSIMTMNLTNKLEQVFGSLPKTLFFEYQTVRALAGYFTAAHADRLGELLGPAERPAPPAQTASAPVAPRRPVTVSAKRSLPTVSARPRAEAGAGVAVVGVAGRYPQAANIREFWRNLVAGRDCITEVPADRWEHGRYYDADKNATGKTYAKWGGFLDDADRFDALFFNISPREAEFMDPQERIFLECVQDTFEDAGYTREELSRYRDGGLNDGLGGNVGVFVGVMYEEYQLYGAQEQARGRNVALSGNPSSIANRVSYFFDLHGPSMAVDTMCSSSLTALHMACQSVLNAECEVAVAGGVNLSLHPNKYLMLGSGKWASSKGLCESFGADGDGYVPGEGVGAVLLKPLERAVADGDAIYGVIRGTAVNHGGKTNGYSVPNPRAQSTVIGRALRSAGVDAGDVSYVEAHGTGTSLGDPIEIAGLTRAFQEHTTTEHAQVCAIGSVKSNIGHAESAAGIAGLTKVLLQLRHGTLVPSLHSETLNPHIDFAATPFQVQQDVADWPRRHAADGTAAPRIAGVSSFGAGGSNAHVIVEEYLPAETTRPAGEPDAPAAIVLSARTEAALRERAAHLLDWLGADGAEVALADIAHTLQTGREAFEERLGLVVRGAGELTQALRGFLAGEEVAGLHRGRVKRRGNDGALRVFAVDEDMAQALVAWIEKKKYAKLLELWVTGVAIDWAKLDPARQRISLPTYPFQRERYWPELGELTDAHPGVGQLHPLVHANTSSLAGQRFSSVFTGDEFFLRDHRVGEDRVLSGAACLELVRAAVAVSLDGEPHGTVRFRNIAWTRPIIVGTQPASVHIGLRPGGGDEIGFEIFSHQDSAAQPVIHCAGMVLVPPEPAAPETGDVLDLDGLRSACEDSVLDAEQVYDAFDAHGITYGPGHRGIRQLWTGAGQAVARLELPEAVGETLEDYGLHPSLVDSAIQAAVGITGDGDGTPRLPFAVDEVRILSGCTRSMWAWVRAGGGDDAALRRLDIDLCAEDGTLAVRLVGVSLRAVATQRSGELVATPYWAGKEHRDGTAAPEAVTVVSGLPAVASALEAQGSARVVRVESDASDVDGRYAEQALQVFGVLREVLAERTQREVCVQLVVPAADESRAGLAGVLRSAAQENPRIAAQTVLVDGHEDAQRVASRVAADRAATSDALVRYRAGAREVLRWRELAATDATAADADMPWRDGGVYLITGGTGGLGALFAADIAARTRGARIVLTGRAAADQARDAIVAGLRDSGAEASYAQVDVAQRDEVLELVRRIRAEHGRLDGVLHSAGVLRDSFILKKTDADFGAVLAPKVAGAVHLDEATRDAELDFLVFFSSTAGVFGNVGQADYAAANAFLDAFAAHRNTLVAAGERRGRTLSLDWPLWAEGGMRVDAGTERALWQNFGLIPLRTPTGIRALYRALAADVDQALVFEGDPDRLAAFVGEPAEPATVDEAVVEESTVDVSGEPAGVERAVLAYFTTLLSSVINLPAARIDPEASLEDYGVDSVMTMDLTRALEEVFGSLSKTLFFEYQSIEALAGYFVTAYPDKLRELVAIPVEKPSAAAKPRAEASTKDTKRRSWRAAPTAKSTVDNKPTGPADIAIVGLAGRYPQARDVHEFWRNLAAGKDCVTEIPEARWQHDRYFDADKQSSGTTYSKWGGFLDGAYEFDPLFFTISPREAELMDPQERLFLQCVYETLQDAGYVRDSARTRAGNVLNGRVGVFAGVMYEDYQLFGAQSQALGGSTAVGGSPASIANRVSYFCNFRGPSMSVDTMCSSSLTSIHLACQSIAAGDCDAAIAGGVNLSLHPNKYLLLSVGNFLSSSGRCQSFGAGGDGYTPGEGVGAVLLKPLAQAVADGDRIHGVIKGSALNHGGKTNGYTVPNPHAQADTIAAALRTAGVGARDVSYLEAHGTGTSLGDPIEITGLSRAFREHTRDNGFCAIGSVKSNIGHAESSAGIAGLTKVLLQLRHRQLAPSLHAETLNPHIDFADTPFTVQRELADWDTAGADTPRIAGISSFGAGGSNAHVIIAEYVPEPAHRDIAPTGPAVVPVSARTETELRDVAAGLADWLSGPEHAELDIADVAYTLQAGREPLAERLGIIATSTVDLVEQLRGFLAGTVDLVRGTVRAENTVSTLFSTDADLDTLITNWAGQGKYDKLLELWANDAPVDWRRLYSGGDTPRRVALPSYPFARERYFPFDDLDLDAARGPRRLHPLVHENTSDLTEQRFTSVFTGREPFLTDHVVRGEQLMPGAALLEMAAAAVCITCRTHAEPSAPVALQNVVLAQPLRVTGEPREVHVGLYPEADGDLRFRIYSDTVHGEGAVYLAEGAAEATLDLPALRAECAHAELTAEQCYAAYRDAGISYGPAHQGIRHLWLGQRQALAHLVLPEPVRGSRGDYTMHPSLLDAALQACLGVLEQRDTGLLVPFAIDDVLILDDCTTEMWALLRPSATPAADSSIQKFDVDLADEHGRVRIRIGGLSFRPLDEPARPARALLHPQWQPRPAQSAQAEDIRRTVLLLELPEVAALLPEQDNATVLTCGDKELDRQYTAYGLQALEHVRAVLRGASTGRSGIQLVLGAESAPLAGLAGLLRTAALENPNVVPQVVILDEADTAETAAERILANRAHPGDTVVRYVDGRREVATWVENAAVENSAVENGATTGIPPVPWKEHGVYLLTGGMGALGLIFAREIATQTRGATLVLAGRSPLSAQQRDALRDLESRGAAAARYVQLDVANATEVEALVDDLVERHGRIDGVLHGAGVTRDGFILAKHAKDFLDVLAPKVAGVVNLDNATRTLPLDFFVTFSSTSGASGNAGQADYAAANAFLDSYAPHRQDLVVRGERSGRSLSINWPLWTDGGMHVSDEVQAMLRSRYGVVPLDTASGVAAFHRILDSPHSQVMVAADAPDPAETAAHQPFPVSSAAGMNQ